MNPATNRMVDQFRTFCGYRFPRLGPLYRIFYDRLPQEVDTELFPGIRVRLDLRDVTRKSTFWKGPRFEIPTPQILAEWGRNGATAFFDIGANYGFFSYWMYWQCKEMAIFAFDPHPMNMRTMVETMERNRLDRFHPVQAALGNRMESQLLHHGKEDSGHSTLGPHPELADSATSPAEVLPFDAWRERQHIDMPATSTWVAKIDVEGYEVRVLQGMHESLAARAFKGLAIEMNPFTLGLMGNRTDEIDSLLRGHGYKRMETGGRYRVSPKDSMNAFFVPS